MVHQPLRPLIRAALLAALALPCAAVPAPDCPPSIEVAADGHSARLRAGREGTARCTVSEADYHATVRAWWAGWPAGSPIPTSLGLGRAVDYPWLSRHIADAALAMPGWRVRVDHARRGELDRLARPVLQSPTLLQRLARPFDGAPLEVRGVSFEKVLFGPASEHASATGAAVPVPFDAQLWLRLAPRQARP